ncbi:MAG TPA: aminotransferase [Clostridiaceae bacterium]|nr:aminotransferase [Clostridiaceae bacterium]
MPLDKVKIYIEISEGAVLPVRGSDLAAGYDLFASVACEVIPGATSLVSTGLKIALPPGYEAQIRPRSGLSLKSSIRIPNSPGTIDADYRDEVKVIIHNQFHFSDLPEMLLQKPELSDHLRNNCYKVSFAAYLHETTGNQAIYNLIDDFDIWLENDGLPFGTIRIKKGDRIAQMVFAKVYEAQFGIRNDVSILGTDRGGGFGSTGLN